MKKFKLLMISVIIATFGFILKSNAQKPSGLYLNYQDYLNHKLSYAADPAKPNDNKISLHEFWGRNKVIVNTGSQKLVLKKDKLYGYRDDHNNDYRFKNNVAYKIVGTVNFYVYCIDNTIQSGKGYLPEKTYYFSKKANDEILPLTPENIAAAFPDNQKFRAMVAVEQHSGLDIEAYDIIAKAHKTTRLYVSSSK